MTRFHLAALNHGVLLAPRGMIALATVMTREVVDEMVDRCGKAMREVVEESEVGSRKSEVGNGE